MKFSGKVTALSCIFSLLTSTANAFTLDEAFTAAGSGDLQKLHGFVSESESALAQLRATSGGNYVLSMNIPDSAGNTMLMKAAESGQAEVVQYLVTKNANIFAQNYAGETAVSLAQKNGYTNIYNYLMNVAQVQQAANAPAEQYPVRQPYDYVAAEEAGAAAAATSPTALGMMGPILWTVAGVGAIGAAIAVGGGGGGNDSGGGGGTGGTGNSIVPTTDLDNDPSDSGGTTGAGNTHPAAGNPANFLLTAEETTQEGYEDMKTNYAHARGYDGRIYVRNTINGTLINSTADGNVRIAMIDGGMDLDHPDLSPALLANSAATCTTSGCVAGGNDTATSGHGTKVAGIMVAQRDGVGIVGIAPAAKIIPIAAIQVTNGSDITAIDYANKMGAQVINASYGLDGAADKEVPIIAATQGNRDTPMTSGQLNGYLNTVENAKTLMNEYQEAVADGIAFVYSAGNASMDQVNVLAGLPYYFQGTDPGGITGYSTINPNGYNWKGQWVAVVGLNDGLTLSSVSNECGIAMDWCIAAPGEIAKSTFNDGGYATTNLTGTSFAAPNVSGAIAVMLGAFPHLSTQDVIEILFDTAFDLGAPGPDIIYGHGLIDLEAATDPSTGGWNLATGPNAFGMGAHNFAMNSSGLGLSAPFGNALHAVADKEIMFLDKYNKNYYLPLGYLASAKTSSKRADEMLREFGSSQMPATYGFGSSLKAGLEYYKSSNSFYSLESRKMGQEDETDLARLAIVHETDAAGGTVSTSFTDRVDAASAYTSAGFAGLKPAEGSISEALQNPYLALNKKSTGARSGYAGKDIALGFGYYKANPEDDFVNPYSAKVESVITEIGFQPAEGFAASIGLGANREEGSFLESTSTGAFGLAPETTTNFISASASYKFGGNLNLFGTYSIGRSQMGVSANSLIKNMSDVTSDSFSLGFEASALNDKNDKLGFYVTQPLRVSSARASIALPTQIQQGGNIIYTEVNANLAPTGQELDLEANYSSPLGEKEAISIGAMLRLEPDHIENAESEGIFLTKYSQQF